MFRLNIYKYYAYFKIPRMKLAGFSRTMGIIFHYIPTSVCERKPREWIFSSCLAGRLYFLRAFGRAAIIVGAFGHVEIWPSALPSADYARAICYLLFEHTDGECMRISRICMCDVSYGCVLRNPRRTRPKIERC